MKLRQVPLTARSHSFQSNDFLLFILLMNFGFMGWGTTHFSSTNIAIWLTTLLIPVMVFASVYIYSGQVETSFTIPKLSLSFPNSSVTFFGIFFFSLTALQIFGGNINLELTGDEIAYARNALGPGVIWIETFSLNSSLLFMSPDNLLKMVNLSFYSISIATYIVLKRIKSLKSKIMWFTIITICLRILVSLLTSVQSPNPPMYAYTLGLLTSFLPLGDLAMRVAMHLMTSIALYLILKKVREYYGLRKALLVAAVIVLNPAILQSLVIIEPAVLGYLLGVYALVIISDTQKRGINEKTILFFAANSYFRLSSFALVVVLCLIRFTSDRQKVESKAARKRHVATLLLYLSIGISLLPQRIVQVHFNEPSGNFRFLQIDVNASQIPSKEVFEFFLGNLGIIGLLLLTILVKNIFYNLKAHSNLLILFVSAIAQYVLASFVSSFFNSKYLLEFLAPLILYPLLRETKFLRYKVVKNISIFCVLLGSSWHMSSFRDSETVQNYSSIWEQQGMNNRMYKYSIRPVYKIKTSYQDLLDKKRTNCLETGINYGIWHQIFLGYRMEELKEQIVLIQKYNELARLKKEKFGEFSIETAIQTGANCLIITPAHNISKVKTKLSELGWYEIRQTSTIGRPQTVLIYGKKQS